MTAQRYRIFGLTVESTIPLPGMPPALSAAKVNVHIARGKVAPPNDPLAEGLSGSASVATLNILEAGRFQMTDGARITVEPSPTASDRNVRLYLLGSAFGTILHQRRLLPLHANVIEFEGRAVAFMGHSGAGKSTLATWFHDRGRPILSDDVGVVHDDDAGVPVVEPGLPRIRLWGDALDATGRTRGDYEASFDDMDKFDVPIEAISIERPLPLGAVYNLQVAAADEPLSITRMTGVAALEALAANTYRGAYLQQTAGISDHLTQCLALTRRVPVFALRRRWGFDRFDEETAAIEEHVRKTLAQR